MYNVIFSIFLFFTCAHGMFPKEYRHLAQEWGVYLPAYNEQTDARAEAEATLYSKDALETWLPFQYSIKVEEVGAYLEMVKFVQKDSASSAIEEFMSCVKASKVLERRKVKITNLHKPLEVTVRDALEYTIFGGISAQLFPNTQNRYIVVALFEFGYSTEYAALSTVFSVSFPQYDLSVERLANTVALTRIPTTPLEEFEGVIQWEDGYSILLIRGLTVKGATERDAMQLCVKALNSKEAWNRLMAKEELTSFGAYEKVAELLSSALPMSGGISISKIELDTEQKAAYSTDKTIAYSVCAYFKLLPMPPPMGSKSRTKISKA